MPELQIFNLSRYAIASCRFYHGKNDIYDKESLLHIYTHLMAHPTKNIFFILDFLYKRMQVLQQYCEDYLHHIIILNNILDNNKL